MLGHFDYAEKGFVVDVHDHLTTVLNQFVSLNQFMIV